MNKIRGKRGRGAAIVAGLLVLVTALALSGIAGAEKPVKVRAGNLELTFNGGFSPKTLSKTKLTPIKLNVSGDIKTVDGTHPPALKEFLFETDKNGAVNVKGYPTCKSGQLQSQDTSHAEAICKGAIIGKGKTSVEIAFPEQTADPGQKRPARLQRRSLWRRDDVLHPRLHHGADPGGDRDHGEDQKSP